jgi:hypothetical protein
MANKMRGLIPIELDKPRTLRYDWNALAEFEDRTGVPITEIGKKVSIKTLRALLFCGLKHEDPTLTEEAVGAMIGMDDIQTIQSKLMEALSPKFSGEAQEKK